MDNDDFIQHWNYFCSLAERLDDTKHYIDHGIDEKGKKSELVHGKVYSDYFKQIIVLAASEFEVACKALCELLGFSAEKENIVGLSSFILDKYPKIVDTEVWTSFWIYTPLKKWQLIDNKVEGLEWWKAYTALKHSGKKSYQKATLENAIQSLASLYVINLYLMKLINGNLNVAFKIPPVYFKSKYTPYPISSGDGELPDDGDLTPFEKAQRKIKCTV